MENYFLSISAAFIGALLANIGTRWLYGSLDAGSTGLRPRHARAFALLAAGVFAIVSGLSLALVSAGDLAPALAAILALLTLAVLAYVGRAMRRAGAQQENSR